MTTVRTSSLLSFTHVASNKVVLVTGGANGVGKAVSLLFAKAHAQVVIGDSDETAGVALVSQIQKNGGAATFRKTNFASWDEQLALFAHGIETYKHVDIVIALAGANPAHEEDWFTSNETNLVAPPKPDLENVSVGMHGLFYTTKLALHHLLRSSGRPKTVVFYALTPPPGSGVDLPPCESAARHGALGLLRSLKTTLTRDIYIRAVAPAIPSKGENPPSDDLVAQTFFYAATNPSKWSHGDIITVSASANTTATTTSSTSAMIKSNPLQTVEIKTVGQYKVLQNRFWWIILINSIIKHILVRIALIFGR